MATIPSGSGFKVPERDGGQVGPQHGHDDIRREHDRQRRRPGDRRRADRQGSDADESRPRLIKAGDINERADPRVERNADQPARGEHFTDGRLVPVRLGSEDLTKAPSPPRTSVRNKFSQSSYAR
jgi:hypothetical protein